MIQSLPVKDIGFYCGMPFLEIIEMEKPEAVLFLSSGTFAHRAFIRYCRVENIPTIHLTHGIFASMPLHTGKYYRYNSLSYFSFVACRLGKLVSRVWPTYLKALWKTGARHSEYLKFLQDNWDLLTGKVSPMADDTITDAGLIYTQSDFEFAKKIFRFREEQIHVVGNPDAMEFGLQEQDISSYKAKTSSTKKILYIDTSLILRGAIFSSVREYVNHLEALQNHLRLRSCELIVKLHPNCNGTAIPQGLEKRGILICPHDRFIEELKQVHAVITESSTAALIPAYMGIPLGLAKFGPLVSHDFGEIFLKYPRSKILKHLEDLDAWLEEPISQGAEHRFVLGQWIDNNLGPRPLDQMPERVAAVVDALVKRKQVSF